MERVLDLGRMPLTDVFPPVETPVTEAEFDHPLTMGMCTHCHLAQLTGEGPVAEETGGVEPQALRQQAAAAVELAARAGLLEGGTVAEYGSPHGGTWIPLVTGRGLRAVEGAEPATVVIDSFGLMHEPDQAAAIRQRSQALTDDGWLLLQFHSLATIVRQGQWTALRHGHYAYYSLTSLRRLLADAGLHVLHAFEFDLYGGTVLLAASRRHPRSVSDAVLRITGEEVASGVTDPERVRSLQRAEASQVTRLRTWLESAVADGRRVAAYGAASRAVPLLARARVDRRLVAFVADASPAKHGRRMPGTDIPIVPPEDMLRSDPDDVLLTLPDLLPEVQQSYGGLRCRWTTVDQILTDPTEATRP